MAETSPSWVSPGIFRGLHSPGWSGVTIGVITKTAPSSCLNKEGALSPSPQVHGCTSCLNLGGACYGLFRPSPGESHWPHVIQKLPRRHSCRTPELWESHGSHLNLELAVGRLIHQNPPLQGGAALSLLHCSQIVWVGDLATSFQG